ncbi:MAG TPA: protein kinase [Acidobacteriota bacterium]|nr:protein kinase [Acidobacteriota bacterium]
MAWEEIEAMALDDQQLRLARQLHRVSRVASLSPDPASSPPTQADLQQSSDPDTGTPRRWGHLIIRERIGGGACGEVYRAWDAQLERNVALKLMRPRSTGGKQAQKDEERRLRLVREARLLAKINDPSVATVYGADTHGGQVGLWMEYVRGRNLDEMVEEQGPCSAGEAVVIGMQVCRAAAMVHQAGVVHRDIKAQNIIRGQGGRIVLTDFGTGYEIPDSPQADTQAPISGTPLYMAPEVLRGEEPTPLSDIYSIGVLLYYLMSRTFPVRGTDVGEIRQGHRKKIFTPLGEARPQLPHAVCRIVEKALDPNPRRRFHSARQMEDALAGVLTDQSLRLMQRPADSTGGGWPRPPLKAVAALLIIVFAALLLIIQYSSPERELRILMEEVSGSVEAADRAAIDGTVRDVLSAYPRFTPVNAATLADNLKLMGKPADSPVDGNTAQELLQRGMADISLKIGLDHSPQGTRLLLEASSASSTLHFDAETLRQQGQIDSLLRQMMHPLLSNVISRSPQLGSRPNYPKVTTTSFEALKHYHEAELTPLLEKRVGLLETAIGEDPQFASAHRALALCQSAMGNSKASLQTITEGYRLRHNASPPESRLIEVQYLQMTGQHHEAIEIAEAVLAARPDDATLHVLVSNDLARIGFFDEAIDHLEQAIRLQPSEERRYKGRIAFILARNSQFREALDIAQELRSPNEDWPYLDWAEAFSRMGLDDFEGAEQVLLKMEQCASKRGEQTAMGRDRALWIPVARYYLAQNELLQGHHEEALKWLERGKGSGERRGNRFIGYLTDLRLAHLYFLTDREDQALQALEYLLEDDFPPQFHRRLRDAALLLGQWGHWDKSGPYIEKLRQIDSQYSNKLTRWYLMQLEGEEYLRQGRIEEARTPLDKAHRGLEDILSAASLARLLEETGSYDSAIRIYREILDRKGRLIYWLPADMLAVVRKRMACCLIGVGKEEEAQELQQELKSFWTPDRFGQRILEAECAHPAGRDTSK